MISRSILFAIKVKAAVTQIHANNYPLSMGMTLFLAALQFVASDFLVCPWLIACPWLIDWWILILDRLGYLWFSGLHTLDMLNDNNRSHGLSSETDCIKEISNFASYILVDDNVKFLHFLT